MVAPNNILSLPNAGSSQENAGDKRAWERLPHEPARLFMLFTQYRLLGSKRSLQALVEKMAASPEAPKSTETAVKQKGKRVKTVAQAPQLAAVKPSVPGDIKAACSKWKWVERARAWDMHLLRQWEEKTERTLQDGTIRFALRPNRVILLSGIVTSLAQHSEKEGIGFDSQMECFKLISQLLKQLEHEMSAYPFNAPGKA